MPSEYLIQVVYKSTGQVVACWEPGLTVEKKLIEELVNRVKAKGVGVFRTEDHVAKDVKTAIEELLWDLKSLV